MNTSSLGTVMLLGGLVAVVWLLHKLGRALAAMMETLAALAVVLVAVWLVLKAAYFMIKAAVTHWRTTLGALVLGVCLLWFGPLVVALVVTIVAVGLTVWRWRHPASFEAWAGRRLRSWWLRWTVYAGRLPGWLRACGLTVRDPNQSVVIVAALGRRGVRRQQRPRADRVPRVLRVRSGASWDEVRVRLVPGQKPEDFDERARELAVARGV